jgi:O-antigen ligase
MNVKTHIQAIGLVMLLFGSPIIHFFRDFLTIIPKNPMVIPLFTVIFLLMMFRLRQLRWVYTPNYNISFTAWAFLGYSMFMALITPQELKIPLEISNYVYLILFFYFVSGIGNSIDNIILKYIILICFVCNLALIVSFLSNPFAHLGERATISNAAWGEGAGNPTLYALVAYACLVACFIEYSRSRFTFKLIILAAIATSFAVLLMTVVRSMIITFSLASALYLVMNYKRKLFTKNKTRWYNRKISKSDLYILAVILVIILAIIALFGDKIANIFNIYSKTFVKVASNVFDTILQGNKKSDASAGNRLTTLQHAFEKLQESPTTLLFGAGYRYLYVDVPFAQVLLEEGIVGFFLIIAFHVTLWKNFLKYGFNSNNPWVMFWTYFYISQFVNSFTRGEPYDPYFWVYYLSMAAFVKPKPLATKLEPIPVLQK